MNAPSKLKQNEENFCFRLKQWESICIGKGEAKICNENCKLSKIGKTKRSISFPGSKPIDRPGQSYALHGNRNIDW